MSECDFCSSPEPRWSYPARDHDVPLPTTPRLESVAAWAACETCHELIEKGARVELAERAARGIAPIAAKAGLEPDLLAMTARALRMHGAFFEHRTGPAVPIVVGRSNP